VYIQYISPQKFSSSAPERITSFHQLFVTLINKMFFYIAGGL